MDTCWALGADPSSSRNESSDTPRTGREFWPSSLDSTANSFPNSSGSLDQVFWPLYKVVAGNVCTGRLTRWDQGRVPFTIERLEPKPVKVAIDENPSDLYCVVREPGLPPISSLAANQIRLEGDCTFRFAFSPMPLRTGEAAARHPHHQ